MNFRFAVLFTVSCAAHAALLGWPQDSMKPLRLGGEARALQISIQPPAPETDAPVAQPAAPPLPPTRTAQLGAREPAARKRPANTSTMHRSAAPAAAEVNSRTAARATAPAARPAAQRDSQALSDRISAALLNRLAERFEYPWLARKRGWQGLVTLSLRVEQNGDLTHWAVSQTSGHSVLDHSALSAAKRIQRLPEAAEWLDGAPVDMLLPVRYRLLDS